MRFKKGQLFPGDGLSFLQMAGVENQKLELFNNVNF
jgi:hypothetical protein